MLSGPWRSGHDIEFRLLFYNCFNSGCEAERTNQGESNDSFEQRAGPGFIRYETVSGQKVIVSKEVKSDLYEKVKADRETWTVINQSKQDGYRLRPFLPDGSTSMNQDRGHAAAATDM